MYVNFLGGKLKAALKEVGMTQEQLAEILKTKHSVISRWISGGRNPKLATVKKIAAATKKNLDWFFDSSIKDVAISSGSGSAIGRNAKVSVDDKEVKLLKREMKLLREENTFLREQNTILKEQLNSRKTYIFDEKR